MRSNPGRRPRWATVLTLGLGGLACAGAAPAVAHDGSARRAPAPLLSLGDAGHAVGHLQHALRRRGIRIGVDGAFGPRTRRAVRLMQRRLGLRTTGVAGPTLYVKLGIPRRHMVHRTRARLTPAPVPIAAPPPASSPTRAGARESATGYLRVFPVAARNSYIDDFGAPRGQGPHEGTDIMADRGAPAVAVDAAVVDRLTRTPRGLGGIYVWLRRGDGTQYYYAHLDTIEPGLQAGSSVAAGQRIGRVGNTGDARFGAPHLHFEIRPAGSAPVNPYRHLIAVDPNR